MESICRFMAAAAVLALVSCSPRVITQTKTEYVYRDRVQVDTTFVHDSVWIREQLKGDTVRIVEYRDRYKYQYRYVDRTDTLRIIDSVAVDRIKEVKVEKPLPIGKKLRLWAFLPLLLLALVGWRKEIWKILKRVAAFF